MYSDMQSYNQMEKQLFSGSETHEKRNNHSLFLQSKVFRKTYVKVKQAIDDWLRKANILDLSVAELKRVRERKDFTRATLRTIKNPRKVISPSVRSSI